MNELFPELNPTKDWLNPPSSTEPAFWIAELRLLSRLSTESDAVIRTISLQKGLNILWSEGSEVDGPVDQRGRGHGAGKTSFCRAIRYILGEKHYGNRFIRERMAANQELSRAYVTAEIWIGNVRWGVARPLYQGGRHFAVPGVDINGAISSDPSERYTHEQFVAQLEEAVLSRLSVKEFDAEAGHKIRWGHVIQPLTRDQETHLSGLHTWRDNASASDSPGFDDPEKPFLIRCLLGLADASEGQLLQKRSKSQNDANTAKNTVDVYRRVFNDSVTDILAVYPDLRMPITHEDGLFVKQVTDRAQQKQKDSIAALDEQIEALGIARVKEALEAAITEKSRIEGRIEERQEQLKSLQTQLLAYKQKKSPSPQDDKELQESIVASLRRKDAQCCVPIETAMKECQLYWRLGIQKLSQENETQEYTASVSSQVETRIQALKDELEPSLKRIKELENEEKKFAAQLLVLREKEKGLKDKREHSLSLSSGEIRIAENIISALEKIESAKTEINKSEAAIIKTDKELSEARDRSKAQQAELSTIFDQIIQGILSPDFSGKLSFSKIENNSSIYRHGELESEAYKALKALAYDLTILLSGLWSVGHHPGFLMHDSPRESDLEPAIYQLFLRLLKDLADRVPNSFQYIVTTTEAPPTELRDSPPVCARLDSSTEEGFLFKTAM